MSFTFLNQVISCFNRHFETYEKASKKGDPFCTDAENTCQGETCRCDMEFGKKLSMIEGTWQRKFHKDNGFDRKKQCNVKVNRANNPGSSKQKACCNRRFQYEVINTNRQECCANGDVANIGQC